MKHYLFDPFADLHDEAQATKKRAVNKMIWVTMGGLKKAFLLWHHEAKTINETLRVRLLYSMFDILTTETATAVRPLIDYKDEHAKEKVILRFIEFSKTNLAEAFNIWRNANRIASLQRELSDEKKKDLIILLQRFIGHNRHSLLRMVLARFFANARIGGT
jgi:hypothetical protein